MSETKIEKEVEDGEENVERGTAKAAGTVLQTVGMLLFLSSCCVCSFAGKWEGWQLSDDVAGDMAKVKGLGDYFRQENWGKVGMMLSVMFPMAGGFAMATFGLGLQADRKRAGMGALVTCLACAVIVLVGGLGIWMDDEGAIWPRIWHVIVSGVMWLTVGLSVVAYRDVRANPPADGVEILPRDYKVPYSMYHDDPPEVRLANEIAGRKANLEAQMREIEGLEKKLDDRNEKNKRDV